MEYPGLYVNFIKHVLACLPNLSTLRLSGCMDVDPYDWCPPWSQHSSRKYFGGTLVGPRVDDEILERGPNQLWDLLVAAAKAEISPARLDVIGISWYFLKQLDERPSEMR